MSNKESINVRDLTVEQVRAMSPKERKSIYYLLLGGIFINDLSTFKVFSELTRLMREDSAQEKERAEDEYYTKWGEEIDQHPIGNPGQARLNPCTTTSDSE